MQVSSTNSFLSPKGAYLLMLYVRLSLLMSTHLLLHPSTHQVQSEPWSGQRQQSLGPPLRRLRHPPPGCPQPGVGAPRDVGSARAGSTVTDVTKEGGDWGHRTCPRVLRLPWGTSQLDLEGQEGDGDSAL